MATADDKHPGVADTLVLAPPELAEARRSQSALRDQEAERPVSESPTTTAASGSIPLPAEEVDVWWGGYASRTMLPSFLICVAATVAIAWLTWFCLPPRLVKISFVGLSGGVWLLQLVRWGYRFFGFSYRLTTRRLFCHLGKLYQGDLQLGLAAVAQVVVRSRWDERLVGVGQVVVIPDKPTTPPLILEGVLEPARIAEMIRSGVQCAREQAVLTVRANA
jgi:hypothetical protein